MRNRNLHIMMICMLISTIVIPTSEAATINGEDMIKLSTAKESVESLGLTYHVFIVGKIRNLNRFGPEITFQTVLVYYYSFGYGSIMSGEFLSIERPFFGLLTPGFICGYYTYTVQGWHI